MASGVFADPALAFVLLFRDSARTSTSCVIDNSETCKSIVLPSGNSTCAKRNVGYLSCRGAKSFIAQGQWSLGARRRCSNLSTTKRTGLRA